MVRAALIAFALCLSACQIEGPRGPPGITGPKGELGPVGPPGEDGEDGEDGLTPTNTYLCNAVVTIGSQVISLGVKRYDFSDRSVLVACAVSDPSRTYSGTNFYRANQNGASSGACSLIYDLDAASVGVWEFTSSGTAGTASYTDSGSANNGRSYPLTCTRY